MAKERLEHKLFKDIQRLQDCLKQDSQHVKFGDEGKHVQAIQQALLTVFNAKIDPTELQKMKFGETTRDAVQAYKNDRKIINFNYQRTADNIVGKMTIAHLDDELLQKPPAPDPLLDPDEPKRIMRVLERERIGVKHLIVQSISILKELEAALEVKSENPVKLLQFTSVNFLAVDALQRFCGMSFKLEISLVREMIQQYEQFLVKWPFLPTHQEALGFFDFANRFPDALETNADGLTVPPAISDAPKAMVFSPRYRDFDASARANFIGMLPGILQTIQLHEMGHFYFGMDDGNPLRVPFERARRMAQMWEFFSRQAVLKLLMILPSK